MGGAIPNRYTSAGGVIVVETRGFANTMATEPVVETRQRRIPVPAVAVGLFTQTKLRAATGVTANACSAVFWPPMADGVQVTEIITGGAIGARTRQSRRSP